MSDVSFPKDARYTKTHEWIKVTGNTAKVGLTNYAQDQLGEIVFVELPEVGRQLGLNEVFGVVESVKAVSDCYTPVSGKVTRVNERLLDSPELVNSDPHGEGWFFEIELADQGDLAGLMDADTYDKYQAEQGAH